MYTLTVLFFAGVFGGAMNALAGGGSFVTLPALIAAGVPSVNANASSTVALWPGGAASAWTYHQRLPRVCGLPTPLMAVITAVGGLLGSLLLLWTPSSTFDVVLPWLLLLATLALAFGRPIASGQEGRRPRKAVPLLAQFALGLYGGYFGGAVGLMMVATWSLFEAADVKALNGPRTLLVSVANTAAVIAFVVAGAVWWVQTVAMLIGGVVGGIAGARLGRILPSRLTRHLTLIWTAAITAVFFARAYLKLS